MHLAALDKVLKEKGFERIFHFRDGKTGWWASNLTGMPLPLSKVIAMLLKRSHTQHRKDKE